MNPHRARTKRRHPDGVGGRTKRTLVAMFVVATAEEYQRKGQALRLEVEKTPGRITPVEIFGWPGDKGIEALERFDATSQTRQALVDWLTANPEGWLLLARCYARAPKGERS